jgi:hypothetical protein
MELYERAKIKERENKEKKNVETGWPFYRPKLVNRNDQCLYDRFEQKTPIYKQFRREQIK